MLGFLQVLDEAIQADTQEGAEPRLRRVVLLEVALLERDGEERLDGIFRSLRREPPLQAQVVIAGPPVPLGQIPEGRMTHLRIAAAQALQNRQVRRGKRDHGRYGAIASTRSGLPLPFTIFSGAAMTIAPVGGS